MTKESFGRRINPHTRPRRACCCAKPRGDVPHEGGVALPARQPAATRSSLDWIRDGAPGDLDDPLTSSASQLVPDKLVLAARPEASAPADRRVQRRHDARRHAAGHLHREQRPFAEVDDEGLVTAGDARRDGDRRPLRADLRRDQRGRARSRTPTSTPRPVPDGQPRSTGTSSRSSIA